MRETLAALLAGTLFGLGLSVSQMINPQKILAFLDFFGPWDPSLAFVLFGAVFVAMIAFRLALKQPRPLFAGSFQLPSRRDIDARLIAGGVMFGVGWGLVGWCPGPAISSIALMHLETFVFVAAMVAGMVFQRLLPLAPGAGRSAAAQR